MLRPTLAVLSVTVALAACSGPSATQFNQDSVTIRTTATGPRLAAVRFARGEAQRLCDVTGRTAEYQSTSMGSDEGTEEHFFICL